MRIETTFVQNTPSSDPDLAYLNKARFILEIANGHGVDGVGILNADIRNRHLWLTLTSGAEINAGAIFTEEELPIASNLRPGIAAFNPEFFNISAGKVSLRTDLNFGLNITELSQYLTENKYATQEWIKAQGYIGKDGLAQYATKNWILEQNYIKASSLDKYLPKNIWDAVFEVAEVDGKQVLKIKHEVIGNLGITAYGTEPDADTGSADALVDLVDVAVSGLKSGDILKYNGTHFVNVPIASIAGASSWEQISGKPEYFPTQWSEINDAPTSLPAADVYPWAKAATKPAYTWDEITDKPSVFTPASHTHLWANITDRPTSLPANGGNADTVDNLHASDLVAIAGEQTITGHKIFKEPLTYSYTHDDDKSITNLSVYTGGYKGNIFIGSNNSVSGNTLIRVAPNGSFIYKYNNVEHQVFHSGNFTPSNKLDKSVWDEAFEIKTVNGVRVISAKLDVLGQKGISAYADSTDTGSAGGGLDYELLKNALTGIITPDGYPFTISSMFLGAIDKSYITGKIGDSYANAVHTHKWTDITDRPTSLPANGGNADTVDNLHAYDFAQATQTPYVDIDTINGRGITGIGETVQATTERHYPIQEAGALFYSRSANYSANQIYGTFSSNRWFVRGGGNGPSEKTPWAEIWTTKNFNPNEYIPITGGTLSQRSTFPQLELVKPADATISDNIVMQLGILSDGKATIRRYNKTVGGFSQLSLSDTEVQAVLNGITRTIWHSGNVNPVTINDDQIITGWKRFTPKTKNGVYNTSGIIGNKDTYGTPLSWNIDSAGSFWHIQQYSNTIALIGVQGCKPFQIRSTSNEISVTADKFNGTATKALQDGNGNVIANSYLPLTGGKAITGDFSVSAGVKIKSNEANIIGRFMFGSIADYRTIVGAFDYDTLLISKSALKRNTNGTEYTIYDSGNLTKLSQLQDDVVSGNYFKLSANRVTNLNDTPINSFFVSSLGPSYSPVSYATFVNGFCFATDNNSSYKKQLVYADDWYVRSQNVGSWGGWNKLWHSGNLNPVTTNSDQIITGWKRFNPSSKNGVFNTTGIIDNKDTYATPLSWTAKTDGSIWNLQQESDSITLIGIQGGKAIKFLSNPSLTQVIADFFNGTATKAQQDGNGNVIANSYLRLSGGTLTGLLTTKSINADGTVTANKFTGPLNAAYTGNGGQQGPGYIGKNSFGCLMMTTTVNGDSTFKNWLICDAYGGSDVGGATAIGVSRQNMKVFAMSSNADRTAWNRTCEIYTTENANRNSVDWTARNITAAGSVSAPTFIGKLSGAATLLAINNNAGQSNMLQFMQMSTQNETNDLPSNTWHHVLKMSHGNGDTYFSRSLAFSFFDNGIYTRYRSNGTAHEWVALYGEHNANRNDVDWTARNINASETGTFKKLVINGIVIEVVNGNLRVNGNVVATGGVTSQTTA